MLPPRLGSGHGGRHPPCRRCPRLSPAGQRRFLPLGLPLWCRCPGLDTRPHQSPWALSGGHTCSTYGMPSFPTVCWTEVPSPPASTAESCLSNRPSRCLSEQLPYQMGPRSMKMPLRKCTFFKAVGLGRPLWLQDSGDRAPPIPAWTGVVGSPQESQGQRHPPAALPGAVWRGRRCRHGRCEGKRVLGHLAHA